MGVERKDDEEDRCGDDRPPPGRSGSWRLDYLPPLPTTDKSAPRPALLGQATAKAGQSVLDVPLAFRPSDPLGGWHAKVTADGQVVIDRDFSVVAP